MVTYLVLISVVKEATGARVGAGGGAKETASLQATKVLFT